VAHSPFPGPFGQPSRPLLPPLFCPSLGPAPLSFLGPARGGPAPRRPPQPSAPAPCGPAPLSARNPSPAPAPAFPPPLVGRASTSPAPPPRQLRTQVASRAPAHLARPQPRLRSPHAPQPHVAPAHVWERRRLLPWPVASRSSSQLLSLCSVRCGTRPRRRGTRRPRPRPPIRTSTHPLLFPPFPKSPGAAEPCFSSPNRPTLMSLALAFPLPRMTVRFSHTHPARRDGTPPSRHMEELPSQPSATIRRDSSVQPRHGQRSLHIPSRPLHDPGAAVSPSSCLATSSSRRPPLSRGELRLHPSAHN
jgi:hypothetical protein